MEKKNIVLKKNEKYQIYPNPKDNHTRSLIIEKIYTYYVPEDKIDDNSNNVNILLKTEQRKYWTF